MCMELEQLWYTTMFMEPERLQYRNNVYGTRTTIAQKQSVWN